MLFNTDTFIFKAEKNASARGRPLQKRYSAFTKKTTAVLAPTFPAFCSSELSTILTDQPITFFA